MKVYRNIDGLKNDALKDIESNRLQLVSVDGKCGSGKSALADYIIKDTGFIHIDLDDDKYLHQNKCGYVEFIKYEILENDLIRLKNSKKVIIVNGICILKILDKIKIQPELKIYVKRLSLYGYWYDGNYFDYSRSAVEIIQEEEEANMRFIEGTQVKEYEYRKTILHELIRYHFEYKPDLTAQILYERLENAG